MNKGGSPVVFLKAILLAGGLDKSDFVDLIRKNGSVLFCLTRFQFIC